MSENPPVAHLETPAETQFLNFLAQDIARHPERLQAVTSRWVAHIRSLVGDLDVDLDAPLSPEID